MSVRNSPFIQESLALIRLALPIALVNISIRGIDLTDAIMAGQHSTHDLAVVSLSLSIWEPVFLFCLGCLYAGVPNIAQLISKNKRSHSGVIVQHNMLIATCLGLFISVLLNQSDKLTLFLGIAPEVSQGTQQYLFFLSLGVPALLNYLVLRGLYESSSRLKPLLVINFIGLIINIPLNYLCIHGIIFPELGGAGCALATAITWWIMLIGLIIYLRHDAFMRGSLALRGWFKWRLAMIRNLLTLGLPIGLALFAEVSMFAVGGILVASLGTLSAASHQIVFDTTSVLFMLPLALGQASTVRVSLYTGVGKLAEARLVARIILVMACVLIMMNVMLLTFLRPIIPTWYTENTEIIRIVQSLLLMIMLLQIPDVLQVSAMGIMRAYKDTASVLWMVLVTYWLIGLPVAYITAKTDWLIQPLGIYGVWTGFAVALFFSAILLMLRLIKQGRLFVSS